MDYGGGGEFKFLDNGGKVVVLVVGATSRAIESFVQQPVLIFGVSWVTTW